MAREVLFWLTHPLDWMPLSLSAFSFDCGRRVANSNMLGYTRYNCSSWARTVIRPHLLLIYSVCLLQHPLCAKIVSHLWCNVLRSWNVPLSWTMGVIYRHSAEVMAIALCLWAHSQPCGHFMQQLEQAWSGSKRQSEQISPWPPSVCVASASVSEAMYAPPWTWVSASGLLGSLRSSWGAWNSSSPLPCT